MKVTIELSEKELAELKHALTFRIAMIRAEIDEPTPEDRLLVRLYEAAREQQEASHDH